MNLMSIVYLTLSALLIVALGFDWRMVKIRTKLNWWRVGICLLLAAIAAYSAKVLTTDAAGTSSSVFIAVFFFIFALWRSGLSSHGIVGSIRSLKPYNLVSQVELAAINDQQTRAIFHFGAVQTQKLVLNADLTTAENFLRQTEVRSIQVEPKTEADK
ncbi:hypothetical protein JCM14202_2126 [Agrilactobacillus composti DSM 18527 = JCM 14202]|nr:hypothetical protein [Agrilactobacillus composti]GAF40236.1 hypothetical protein JCM14202_2126 [Agrilactobacillus composti DSM 18527 = JCM 14202]